MGLDDIIENYYDGKISEEEMLKEYAKSSKTKTRTKKVKKIKTDPLTWLVASILNGKDINKDPEYQKRVKKAEKEKEIARAKQREYNRIQKEEEKEYTFTEKEILKSDIWENTDYIININDYSLRGDFSWASQWRDNNDDCLDNLTQQLDCIVSNIRANEHYIYETRGKERTPELKKKIKKLYFDLRCNEYCRIKIEETIDEFENWISSEE
jgi:hypothetical protein